MKPKPKAKKRKRITVSQARSIANKLHDKIQFYDAYGQPDNKGVLDRVEAVLASMTL